MVISLYQCEIVSASCVSLLNWFLQILDAIVSHGCFLRECSVEHSIVGVRLEYGVELKVS
jgi:hypothetical protein